MLWFRQSTSWIVKHHLKPLQSHLVNIFCWNWHHLCNSPKPKIWQPFPLHVELVRCVEVRKYVGVELLSQAPIFTLHTVSSPVNMWVQSCLKVLDVFQSHNKSILPSLTAGVWTVLSAQLGNTRWCLNLTLTFFASHYFNTEDWMSMVVDGRLQVCTQLNLLHIRTKGNSALILFGIEDEASRLHT